MNVDQEIRFGPGEFNLQFRKRGKVANIRFKKQNQKHLRMLGSVRGILTYLAKSTQQT